MENRTNDGRRAAEQYLYRYGRLRARVKEWEEEIRELFARKYSLLDSLLRAPQTDREKVRGGKLADPVYETVEKLVDGYDAKIKRAAEELAEAEQEWEEARRVIGELDLPETWRQLIELRYVQGMGVQEIARQMRYSCENIYRIRKKLLIRLEEFFRRERTGKSASAGQERLQDEAARRVAL